VHCVGVCCIIYRYWLYNNPDEGSAQLIAVCVFEYKNGKCKVLEKHPTTLMVIHVQAVRN